MKVDPVLLQEFQKRLEESQHKMTQKVFITSAYKLDTAEIDRILAVFPQIRDKEYENIVDKNLLGGIIIRFGSKVIDLSIEETLDSFLKHIYEIN